MSFRPDRLRPLATGTWGHRTHFRGTQTSRIAGIVGTVVYRSIGARANPSISGVTRDSAGAILVSCVVDAFVTGTDAFVATTTSDAATGAFSVIVPVSGPFYLVAYKAGAPDVAGTSVNTLVAV